MKTTILLTSEVADELRVSESTVNRWLGDRRKGIGTFPLPISQAGGKRRWLQSDIESFIDAQSTAMSPVAVTAKTKRRNERTSRTRQEQVDRALNKYRSKGKK